MKERYFPEENNTTGRSELVWDKSKIILLIGLNDIAELDEIDNFNGSIQSQFNNIELIAVNIVRNFSPEKNDFKILSYNDFSVTGKPGTELTKYFSESRTDLLVSLIAKPGIFERHVIRILQARYKLGLSGEEQVKLYDIILESDSEDKLELISHAKHYINNLNINK